MHMALKTHRWTRADLERLPDDGNKYEVVRGELLVSPGPRPAHEYIKRVIAERLIAFCATIETLHVFVESTFVDDDSETRPDIVVRASVLPPPEKWDDMPTPALVVEILSKATRRNDEVKKRRFYIESGIPEYWILDGETRSVRVVTSAVDRRESGTLRWMPAGASAALEIDLRRLFDAAIGPPM